MQFFWAECGKTLRKVIYLDNSCEHEWEETLIQNEGCFVDELENVFKSWQFSEFTCVAVASSGLAQGLEGAISAIGGGLVALVVIVMHVLVIVTVCCHMRKKTFQPESHSQNFSEPLIASASFDLATT